MNATPRKRSRFLRFSLRTLLCFVLLAGSIGLLARNWAPWYLEHAIPYAFLSPDKRFALNKRGRETDLLDLEYGRIVFSYSQNHGFCDARFSPDGSLLARFNADNVLEIDRSENGARISAMEGVRKLPFVYTYPYNECAAAAPFSLDGKKFVAWDASNRLCVFEVATGKMICRLEPVKCRIDGAAFSADGSHLFAWDYPRVSAAFDAQSGASILSSVLQYGTEVFSPDLRFALGFDAEHSAICDFKRRISIPVNAIENLKWEDFGPGSPHFEFAGDCKTMFVKLKTTTLAITAETGEAKYELKGTFFAFKDKALIATRGAASSDRTFLWKIDTGQFVSETNDGSWYWSKPSLHAGLTRGRILTTLNSEGRDLELGVTNEMTGEVLAKLERPEPHIGYHEATHCHTNSDASRVAVNWVYSEDILSNEPVNELRIYRNRRPERWWGLAWLPEFWAAFAFFSLFTWSLVSDWRVKA